MTTTDTRRYYLAGYLSGRIPEFTDHHPDTLLDLADDILAAITELDTPTPGLDEAAHRLNAAPPEQQARFADLIDQLADSVATLTDLWQNTPGQRQPTIVGHMPRPNEARTLCACGDRYHLTYPGDEWTDPSGRTHRHDRCDPPCPA